MADERDRSPQLLLVCLRFGVPMPTYGLASFPGLSDANIFAFKVTAKTTQFAVDEDKDRVLLVFHIWFCRE